MEEYEHAALADPFAAAVSCFTQLVADLSCPDTLTAHHHEVEEMAAERGREPARLLLQGHLDLRASREEAELSHRDAAERAVLADGRTRLEKGHHRELATVVGSVRVSRCALRAPDRANCYPADAALSLYDAAPSVRRPHDIIAPPGGRSDQRTPRPGPKAQAKWLTGSVEHGPQQVIAAAFDQARARDPQHQRCWVVLVDGARRQLELIQAEAERRGVKIHIVLGLIHVIEKLWAASRCLFTATDSDAEDWIVGKAARILAGCAAQATGEMRTEADRHGLTDDQRAGIDKACHYLANNADFVHYDRALAAGWPIASGVIEGAARHLIADRLDITGSRWSVPGAEALLILRAITSNGDFPAYWDFHVHAEHQRLHAGADQANYKLTA